MADTTTPRKKTWNTPELYLLDTTDVNGGNQPNFKEGAHVGGSFYQVLTNAGGFLSTASKAQWDNYHS
jgi:hypothetical protein